MKAIRLRNLETGSEKDLLTGDWAGSARLAWSPDGTRLLVNINRFTTRTVLSSGCGSGCVTSTPIGYEVKVIDVQSGSVSDLAVASDVQHFDAKLLRDGNVVARIGTRAGNLLAILRSDGALVRTLYQIHEVLGQSVSNIESFDVSADGLNVAFGVYGAGSPAQLLIAPVNGGTATRLTDLPESEFPGLSKAPAPISTVSWSPDGAIVGFILGPRIGFDGLLLCTADVATHGHSCRNDMRWSLGGYAWLTSKQVALLSGDLNGATTIFSFDVVSGARSTLLTGERLQIRETSPDRDFLLVMRFDPATTTATMYPFRVSTMTLGSDAVWQSTNGFSGQVAWGVPARP